MRDVVDAVVGLEVLIDRSGGAEEPFEDVNDEEERGEGEVGVEV